MYFCHEPRRVDYERAAAARVNPRTRLLYGGLHGGERRIDRIAVAAADELLTNSSFTAHRIERAYGRDATPIPLGVAETFRAPAARPQSRHHLLSVGTLITGKGHDLAIRPRADGATVAAIVVAPRAEAREAARRTRSRSPARCSSTSASG